MLAQLAHVGRQDGNLAHAAYSTCFAAASVAHYTAHLGPAAASALLAIGQRLQQSADCLKACSALPDQMKHFTEQMNRACGCSGLELNPDQPWLISAGQRFHALVQRVQADLEACCTRSWFAPPKCKGMCSAHVDGMDAILRDLDDALQQAMLQCVRDVVDCLDGFGLPAGSPQPSVMPSHDAALVAEALEFTRLVLAKVVFNSAGLQHGQITEEALWNVEQLQDMAVDRQYLHMLIVGVFDSNGDGNLDFEEAIMLSTTLQQLRRLFYVIPHRCEDTDYVTATTAVQAIKRLGHNCIREDDMLQAAQIRPGFFRQCEVTHELQVSYQGFLTFYLLALDRHHLWDHARSRFDLMGAWPEWVD